jgi:hypothetical protein
LYADCKLSYSHGRTKEKELRRLATRLYDAYYL